MPICCDIVVYCCMMLCFIVFFGCYWDPRDLSSCPALGWFGLGFGWHWAGIGWDLVGMGGHLGGMGLANGCIRWPWAGVGRACVRPVAGHEQARGGLGGGRAR